jgi:cation diffusion facilitator CzcD-associated flavoprotein CzcO
VSHSHVAVVGAGFGGLAAAVRLLQEGVDDVVLLERGEAVGGVWRDNAYPGAACDVPSHLYSLSFAPKHDWSRRFARQPEILDYLRDVADRFDLRRRVRLRTEVLAAAFDEATGTWELSLSDGTTHTCRAVVFATGQLSQPAVPPIPGLDGFTGPVVHSAQWPRGLDLTGRSVAVVGTGASAIQVVPEVARVASSVTVFQRDAPHVLHRPDRPYPRAWSPVAQRLDRWRLYWQFEARILGFRHPAVMKRLELRWTRHLRAQVRDARLREVLTSSSPMGCRRILVSDDYYPALTQPHVTVVPQPVAAVTPEGVVDATGETHPADVVVLCTGFDTHRFLGPVRVTGLGGRDLHESWEGGASAHLGVAVSGFPNLFLVYGPGTNLAHSSITLMLEAQAGWVAQAVGLLDRCRWVDVRPQVQRAWDDRLQRRLSTTVWAQGCTSWYKRADGRIDTNWSDSVTSYRLRLRRLRVSDLHLEPVRERVPA